MARLVNSRTHPGAIPYALQDYEALDGAGNRLGTLESVITDADTGEVYYVVIDSGGWFSSKQFVAPVGDIAQVNDAERFVVFERLSKDLLGSGAYPRYDDAGWQQADDTTFAAHAREIARAYEPARPADQAVDYGEPLYQPRPWHGTASLQLLEERLVPTTEAYVAGGVRVSKRVVTRTETVAVELREEVVIIERLPGEGRVLLGDRELQDGETLELPVLQERAVVTKEQVVHEEVHLRTEQVQRTEHVSDTVRREELAVDDAGGNVRERRAGVPEHAYAVSEPAANPQSEAGVATREAATRPSPLRGSPHDTSVRPPQRR